MKLVLGLKASKCCFYILYLKKRSAVKMSQRKATILFPFPYYEVQIKLFNFSFRK